MPMNTPIVLGATINALLASIYRFWLISRILKINFGYFPSLIATLLFLIQIILLLSTHTPLLIKDGRSPVPYTYVVVISIKLLPKSDF